MFEPGLENFHEDVWLFTFFSQDLRFDLRLFELLDFLIPGQIIKRGERWPAVKSAHGSGMPHQHAYGAR